MKIKMHTTIKTAIAALLLSGGSALAENNPPTQYQCWNGWIKSNPADCPPLEVPKGTDISNSQVIDQIIENKLTATGGAGGKGGNATATAKGGAGGAGGNADQRQGQKQDQNQSQTLSNSNSASTGPISIVNDTRVKQAASSAAPALIQSTGNTLCDGGGSLSMTMQTFEWGVAVGGKKGDRFCQMVAIAGDKGGIAYLAHKDRAARAALIDIGLVVDGKTTAATVSIPVAKVPTCPAGSEWDGKGCWKPGGHR